MRHYHYKLSLAIIAVISLLPLEGCKKNNDKPTVLPPVKVTVMTAAGSRNENSQEFSGTVSSSETTTVSFSVAGTISELKAKEGDRVTKGMLLGKLRDGEYVNANNIAEAQLAEARDGYERLKKLHDANALPDVKWVEMQQKLKQAQNAAEIARRTLGDAQLYSPVTGTITRKLADVGQTVVPVEPVYEIVSISDLTIDISVSENEIGKFHIGQDAIVKLDAAELEALPAKVSQKTVVADPLTRSYTVKLSIPSLDGKVLPGMLGKVTFENESVIEGDGTQITLPSQAVLLNEDNRLFVWIVKDRKAERKFIEADELTRNGVIVKSGLAPGDSVIIAGMQKVGSGTIVSPELE